MTITHLAEPGWYTHPGDSELMLWWDGHRWMDADRPVPPSESWIVHFLKFVAASVVAYFALAFLIGLVAMPFALGVTGRRPRDFFMLFIPLWGSVVLVQTLWRLTASRMCWLPRRDRLSKPLFGPAILPKDVIPPQVRQDMNL